MFSDLSSGLGKGLFSGRHAKGVKPRPALHPWCEALEVRKLLTSTATHATSTAAAYSDTDQTLTLSASITTSGGSPVCGGGTLTFTVRDGTTVVGQPVTIPLTYSISQPSIHINNRATYVLPAGTTVGTYSIEVDYSGTTNGTYYTYTPPATFGNPGKITTHGGLSLSASSDSSDVLTVLAHPSTTTGVSGNVSYPNYGQAETVTAKVSSLNGAVPTGEVQFLVDGVDFGAPVTLDGAATASFTTSSLPGGTHAIEADYLGNSEFLPSSGTFTVAVFGVPTHTTLSSDTVTSALGQPVSFRATVVCEQDGTPTPTGEVQFLVNGVDLGSPVQLDANGSAGLTTSVIPGGSNTVSAFYISDGQFNPSLGLMTIDVTPASSTTTVTAPAAPIVYGTATSITATVTADSPGGFLLAGSIQFLVDGVDTGSPVVIDSNGQASASLPVLHAGSHEVTAVFLPSSPSFSASDDRTAPSILTVTPAPLTIGVEGVTAVYGSSPSTLSLNYVGFVNGDTASSLTNPAMLPNLPSHAGSCTISASGAVDPDYVISYTGATLTITPAPLTITADDAVKVYGAALPTFTATYKGFVNGDSPASLATPTTLLTPATSSSHVGSYQITAGAATDPDYTISSVEGRLVITASPLTITANDATKVSGAALPTFTATYSGFVNGDTPASLATPTTLSTPATDSSPAGSYPIAATNAIDPDYTITFVSGTLTVKPAPTPAPTPTPSPTPTPTLTPTAPGPNVESIVVLKRKGKIRQVVIQFGGGIDAVDAGSTGAYRLAVVTKKRHKTIDKSVGVTAVWYESGVNRTVLTLKAGVAASSPLRLTIAGAVLGGNSGDADYAFTATEWVH